MLSNGDLAVQLIQHQLKLLVKLQTPVLSGRDPEDLHQMRVAMRRLRSTVEHLRPALQLPIAVSDARLAKAGRRLGLARDLDVLQHRLDGSLMPQLPDGERRALRLVIKQLRRERQLAHRHVVEQLQGGPYLELLAQLQRWLKKPALTPLGEAPLSDWLLEWQVPQLSKLFLNPAWFLEQLTNSEERESLHGLRKQIKAVRYQLENCRTLLGPASLGWLDRFKQMQELLGELNDLQVLQKAIDDQMPLGLERSLPKLHGLLDQAGRTCWVRWRDLVERHHGVGQRRQLLQALLADQRRAHRRRQAHQLRSWIRGEFLSENPAG